MKDVNDCRIVLAFLVLHTFHFGASQISYTESNRKQFLEEINFQECCQMPRLIADDIIERCHDRPLPPVPQGVPDPIPANCQGECVLNETGILVHHQFFVEQAVKMLVGRVPNDNGVWAQVIEKAARKCYNLVVTKPFYLQDVAKNLISSQCIPSSIRFLECIFAISYRDCPADYWDYTNVQCRSAVSALNDGHYLFLYVWKI